MKTNNKKSLKSTFAQFMTELFWVIVELIVRSLVWVARFVWKRYFGIETPLYKVWHAHHAKRMQKALDREHELKALLA